MTVAIETKTVVPIAVTKTGTVLTPEDAEDLVNIFNADDPDGSYVMFFVSDDPEDGAMVTDLNDFEPITGEFLFI